MFIYIISGLSGAGKSVALHAIEDQGGYCIDNLPLDLLPAFTDQVLPSLERLYNHVGLSIDVRNSAEELERVPALLEQLFGEERSLQHRLIFIEATPETLVRRFGESRRPHPLSHEGLSLKDAIQGESRQLTSIAAAAEIRIDTSKTSIYQLRSQINGITGHTESRLFLKIQSFGFKHGVPTDVDFLFDARCLPNPHWEAEIRDLTGLDPEVTAFLDRSPESLEMAEEIKHYIQRWIPRFLSDDRSYLTIAIGCTGGRHRSVYLVEKIGNHLRNLQDSGKENGENVWRDQCTLNIHHRELGDS